ncbi:FAD binding domain-containing protein [Phytohabitans kaempferiae]|uniref:FAD binding domain-containing protein n=1 Tax=Phytohabitans kaempferiae TaxID=1620943 RepID=A0ABV6M2J5_9ACTN
MLPDFTLLRPATVAEACALLAEQTGEAAAYAGGTELLLAMKLGEATPRYLVDLKGVPGLDPLTVHDGVLRIGALVTHRRLERAPLVAQTLPALAWLERRLANPRIRATGTVGGNLASGRPHSDLATFLIAAGATVSCVSSAGAARTVAAADLTVAPFQTVLTEDEVIVGVDVPVPAAGTALAHQRFILVERPAATVTVRLTATGGVVTAARVVAGAASPIPAPLPAAADALVGVPLDAGPVELRQAGEAAAETLAVAPGGDEAYQRQLVAVLVRRAAHAALADLAFAPR